MNGTPLEGTPVISNNRRPISSPVRSTTYVLQQHQRINNTNNNHSQTNGTSKKHLSPVTQPLQSTPVVLNKTRQIQQQRTYSNHERSPSTVNASPTSQQFTSRAQITLTSQRTTPIVKSTPTKTTTYTSRSPRIPHTPPIRPCRPTVPNPTVPSQQRSPNIQLRSRNLISTTQRTISSSPTTPHKVIRPHHIPSKSPEQLQSVTGTLTRSRPVHAVVNKSKMVSTNNPTKIRTPTVVVQPTSTTPRVSDLDELMAEKQNNKLSPKHIEKQSTVITPSPIADNICRSLFSTNSVKVVRPVRSQELKTFSCHLTTSATVTTTSNEKQSLYINETASTITPAVLEQKPDNLLQANHNLDKNDDSSSNASGILRDLSEDSLNEHYHIKQLLKSNVSITAMKHDSTANNSSNDDIQISSGVTSWSRIRSSCESNLSHILPLKSDTSASPAFYNGPVRQEDIQMASDGRYFLLIDDNISSDESELSTKSLSSSSLSLPRSLSPSPLPPPVTTSIPIPVTTDRKSAIHRLVFPERLGRIIFYRRTLSDSDIYQKLCSKDNEINHNVYHLDTIRDYAMEFYMLTTYGSDSQLRAWFDNRYDDTGNNTCYFDDNRFQSYDDDDDDDDDDEEDNHSKKHRIKIIHSNDSIIPEEDLNHLQVEEELDWYSELESFNLSPNNQQWKHENLSSCSSDDHVEELLRAEQFSVSSLTTTTSAESSCSADLISASWPLANGIHYPVHSSRSSQSLSSRPSSKHTDPSNIILKEILTYPWTNEILDATISSHENGHDQIENGISTASVVSDEFQPDFYYLCPLKNTTSFPKNDEKFNGIH
ncbi:hypothetical protein I4U23_019383 [Adineta vaga]|nr:hypothetical protein I4U23_019383 [Adineta vaga]